MAHTGARTAGRCRCGKTTFRRYRQAAGVGHRIGALRVYWCPVAGGWHCTSETAADYTAVAARYA